MPPMYDKSLPESLVELMDAHQAFAGQPTEANLKAVAYHSGWAAKAIMLALGDACKAGAEAVH